VGESGRRTRKVPAATTDTLGLLIRTVIDSLPVRPGRIRDGRVGRQRNKSKTRPAANQCRAQVAAGGATEERAAIQKRPTALDVA